MEAVHRLLRARLSAPHPFQHAIKPALEGPQDHLVEVRRKLRSRRDLTLSANRLANRGQRRVDVPAEFDAIKPDHRQLTRNAKAVLGRKS